MISATTLKTVDAAALERMRLSFEKNGYLHVPGVLSQEEVAFLRTWSLEKFADPSKNFKGADYHECIFEIFARWEETSFVLFKQQAIDILRALLGEKFALIRGTSVHLNRYGWWWHKDTSNQEREGLQFHHEPDYLMVQTAYYLQDNTKKFGGGLEVEVGSHLLPDPFHEAPGEIEVERGFIERLFSEDKRKKVSRPKYNDHLVKRPTSLQTKAGDLVIFHYKLNHRASQPSVKNVPPEMQKLAIFQTYSRNNRHVDTFNAYCDRIYGNAFTQFPYPPSVVQRARECGIHLS